MNIGTETAKTKSESMGRAVESLVNGIDRKKWERRWYENRYFDDGFHFRYLSKKTGRIIDYAGKQNTTTERAIPKASRQIRGVANLMQSAELSPVVYPEYIEQSNYDDPMAFQKADAEAKRRAKRTGNWLTNIWTDYDEGLAIKFIDMMLSAAKDCISYIQVYSPEGKQKLCFDVFDAFDLNLYGEYKELEKLPFIDKSVPMRISEVKNHPYFADINIEKLVMDNKYANSDIKDAYMRARFGLKTGDGKEPTLIMHETHFKEVLNVDNWQQAIKIGGDTGALEGKSKGDVIMRHVFSSGGVTLDDEYIAGDGYPYVDFRYEPGPLYQTPLIERFIPQNKSLDIIMTRLESWINAMVIGVYQKRKGENHQVSNFPGGQMLEYEQTKLEQMRPSSAGDTPFRVIDLLNSFIAEQGASTSALNNLPTGVKSGVAIESIKATEYANLKISTIMLKNSIQRISAKAIEVVDQRFVKPETVYNMDNGNPDYFSIVGARGYQKALEVGAKLPADVVPIKTGTKLRIEIEPGFGLTIQGKREAVQQIIDYMIKLAEQGYMTKPAVKIVLDKFLQTFGYGSTQELMDALDTDAPMSEDDIMKMKIALLEGLKEAGQIGPENEQRLINSTKIGTVEALKDTGMLDRKEEQPLEKPPTINITFDDLPPEGKSQAAAKAGLSVTPGMFINDSKARLQNEAALKKVAPPMQKQAVKKT